MTHPTDPAAAAMREAAAKLVEESFDKPQSIPYAWNSVVSKGTLKRIATAIRAIPIPAAQPDPRDEALRIAREALAIAEHELTTLNCLRATDLTEELLNACLGNGVERNKLEWVTDTAATRDLVSNAWLAVDAAIDALKE